MFSRVWWLMACWRRTAHWWPVRNPWSARRDGELGEGVVRALLDRGMVHLWSHSDRLVPVAPHLVLHTALVELQCRLLAGQQTLMTGHERMVEAARMIDVVAGADTQGSWRNGLVRT